MNNEAKPFSIITSYAKKYGLEEETAGSNVLLHIPKCAGNSCNRLFRAHACYNNLSFLILTGSHLNYKCSYGVLGDLNRQLLTLGSFHTVCGHLPYASMDRIVGNARFYTVLRDPADRLISAYYVMNQGLTDEDADGLLKAMRGDGPDNYVWAVDNLQVRMLCSQPGFHRHCTQEMLEEAKENLEKYFALVGIVEDLDAFLSMFLTLNEMPSVVYKPINVNEERPNINNSSPMYGLAADFNRFDFELYNWAKGHIETLKKNYIPQEKGEIKKEAKAEKNAEVKVDAKAETKSETTAETKLETTEETKTTVATATGAAPEAMTQNEQTDFIVIAEPHEGAFVCSVHKDVLPTDENSFSALQGGIPINDHARYVVGSTPGTTAETCCRLERFDSPRGR